MLGDPIALSRIVPQAIRIIASRAMVKIEQGEETIMSFGFDTSEDVEALFQKSKPSTPKNVNPGAKSEDPLIQLVFEDGTSFCGTSFGAEKSVAGEVVFNTGMVGYPESLTDPSYRGQILVLTYPLIGNYGVPSEKEKDALGLLKNFESNNIHIRGLIVASYSEQYSHWQAEESLSSWLKRKGIPAITGIDTRALTKKLRVNGSMLGKIEYANESIPFDDPNEQNLVAEVSRKEPEVFGNGSIKIIAVDCGIKNNIIRFFMNEIKADITLKVVPWDYDYTNEEYDGLFISNGPGNPEMASKTIEYLRVAIKRDTPIFGICLGNQLLALAAGAKTYKMKFGNRGMNQPCVDLRTTKCYITPQNHGFAVDDESLPKDWEPFFRNANDNSNEGIIHSYKPFFSVQFHPEAMGGPHDTSFLFDLFMTRIQYKHPNITTVPMKAMEYPIQKVLLVGSGGLSIGQAGEFDYSGSQAIKALKEENIYTILLNPNIATVQTSAQMADKVYFLPVTVEFVSEVIKKERPDGILLQFGGQTALNCGIRLKESGILEEYDVKVLGTPIDVIESTEDREIFSKKLSEINERMAPSICAGTVDEALEAAEKIGYPVLVRAAFALGGLGSGFADNPGVLKTLVHKALASSTQVIIDKSLRGWKEVEYEVVRDSFDNCISVCNMENFDPLGIHTGDSVVVCPSQTLSNREYFQLRSTAIKTIRHLGVVGECNIQYALDPKSLDYCIIEVNARLSRSSALASKATGYPLAYVACKIALGRSLVEIRNSVTKKTTACFEPSLDYCVVKFPLWDLKKFSRVSNEIGSSMKSVGEVMAIGRTFEETIQKSLRMMDDSIDGFGHIPERFNSMTNDEIEIELRNPTDSRIFIIALAFQRNYSVDQIHAMTFIDLWFLNKLKHIMDLQEDIRQVGHLRNISMPFLKILKENGFSDRAIARNVNSTEIEARKYRVNFKISPFTKQIDTLAAEFPAQTNYLYTTYNAVEHDIDFDQHGVMVLGCGAYRIGSSCEFDWCAVSCIRTLKALGHRSIMVNYNPETVSTDFDECDRLYFEELTFERVLDIYDIEKSSGIVVSVGGQIPNNLVLPLHGQGVRIMGTHPASIDNAEDRFKFSALLDSIGVDQPLWNQLTTFAEAKIFAESVGYPVLVRPSYVLSGAAMNVAYNDHDLERILKLAAAVEISSDAPAVISKFIEGAKEIEMDAVASDGVIINYAISEHLENAGVHSGDASLILPAQKLYIQTLRLIKKCATKIAKSLNITGPFNIQFISKDNEIKVIECNLRASRSFPFVSKTFNVNFIELATKAMIGAPVKPSQIDLSDIDFVHIKVPMFSFTRLQGADPVLSVEMASTGEVSSFGDNKYEAYLKALFATGFKMPKKNILLSAGNLDDKLDLLKSCKALQQLGFSLFASPGTADFLKEYNVKTTTLYKPSSKKSPAVVDYITSGKIDLVINTSRSLNPEDKTDGYYIRRAATDFAIPLITNSKCAMFFTSAIQKVKKFSIKSWDEYLRASKLMP